MSTEKEITPVQIFSGSDWEVELLKSILTDHQIESYLFNAYSTTINPYAMPTGGDGQVQLMVSSTDVGKAKPLVEEFKKNQK